MSLYDKLKSRGAEETMDVAMAVMAPIVAAMLADGKVEEEEVLHVETICATSPIFERNSSTQNQRLILQVTRMIEDRGPESVCKRAAAVLSPALRETAFVHAGKIVFSDGYVGELERQTIDRLTDWLELEPQRAAVIMDVVAVMQNPPDA